MTDIATALLAYAIMIGFLTIIHEMGHYGVARMAGLHASAFSIGFGPPLLSWTSRHGTKWNLSPILVGGYVQFPQGQDTSRLDALPYWPKMAVIAAGPAVNIIAAYLLFWAVLSATGINITPPRVEHVEPESPAATANITPGDLITAINGRKTRTASELILELYRYPGKRVNLTIERDGRVINTAAHLAMRKTADDGGNHATRGYLGIRMPETIIVAPGPIDTMIYAGRLMAKLATVNIDIMGQIGTGERDIQELSGPIRIASTAGTTLKQGLIPFLFLSAVASLSIAIINLLPIPGLDGSHLVRYTIEQLAGRPMSPEISRLFYGTGAACITLLIIMLIANDLMTMI